MTKSQYFPFWMVSAKQGHYWYHFYNAFDMTRSLNGDWTRDLPHSKPALDYRGGGLENYKNNDYLLQKKSSKLESSFPYLLHILPVHTVLSINRLCSYNSVNCSEKFLTLSMFDDQSNITRHITSCNTQDHLLTKKHNLDF